MENKVCKKCGIEKPVSDFSKAGIQRGKQYYHTTCKKCTNKGRTRTDNIDPKVCNKCGISKSLSEYALEKRSSGMRYRGECKACKYARRIEFRAENPEVVQKDNARNRWRRANVPGVAERGREISNKSRERHGEKWKETQRERYANDLEYAEKHRQYQREYWASMTDEQKRKHREKTEEWIENNKERYEEYRKQYFIDNREYIAERNKKYRQENPEHCAKLRRAIYEKHQEKLVKDQKRIRTERRQILEERLGGKCVRCGETENLHFDHIIQEDKCYTIGSSITSFSIEELFKEVDKCQLLCPPCHIQKSIECGDYGYGSRSHLSEEAKQKRIKR